jgi:predicted deacylase
MKKILILLSILLLVLSGCRDSTDDAGLDLEEVAILEGSTLNTVAYIYNPEGQGRRFGIIAGIHGNETAGFTAADQMMMDIIKSYKDATILFIPKANALAIEEDRRYAEGHSDLNRSFNVEMPKSETEKLASAIKEVVLDFQPEFLIDHHESKANYLNVDGKYQLGNTVIVTDAGDNIYDNLMIVEAINERITDDIPFKLEANPPEGSFNRTFSETLGIYVATIETNRQLPLEKRVEEQKIVTEEILKYFMKSSD